MKAYILSAIVKGMDGKSEFVQMPVVSGKSRDFLQEIFIKEANTCGLSVLSQVYTLELPKEQLKALYDACSMSDNAERKQHVEGNVIYGRFGK